MTKDAHTNIREYTGGILGLAATAGRHLPEFPMTEVNVRNRITRKTQSKFSVQGIEEIQAIPKYIIFLNATI